ncbi:MAG: tetraacyldisaccharide 4'-kinase [Bacteroidota bacterium]
MGWEIILSPFAFLYKTGTSFRNHLYNIGHKKSFRFEVFTIGVGNLTVGGTGKTPMVEYLIRLLKESYNIVTLSRGYGRSTKGFILASEHDNATTLGDEPFQFYHKFKDEVKVAVGEERVLAIPEIINALPKTDLVLLDDIFQHRSVDPHVNILLCDYNRPFFKDFLLPMGRLRESRKGAQRADIILVTKCPENLSIEDQNEFISKIKTYSKQETPIYFSKIKYGQARQIKGPYNEGVEKVILVSGLASSGLFENYANSNFEVLNHFKFEDHHDYKEVDLKKIHAYLKEQSGEVKILTTEKDVVKLKNLNLHPYFEESQLLYLPIEFEFNHSGEKFDKSLLDLINTYYKTPKN